MYVLSVLVVLAVLGPLLKKCIVFLGNGLERMLGFFRNNRMVIIMLKQGFGYETCLGALSLIYEINSMFWIGALFMFWDLVDKYYELVYKRVDFVWAGLVLVGALTGLGYVIQVYRFNIMESLKFLIA